MLFRLIGKLYFYFVIVPFVGRILKAMFDNYVDYMTRKTADPTWTMEKQHKHNRERLARRRRSSTRH